MNFDTIVQLLQQPIGQYHAFVMLSFVPVARIFERAGFRPYWAMLLAVPMVGLIIVFATLALRKWRTT